jgi:hypothetical protein
MGLIAEILGADRQHAVAVAVGGQSHRRLERLSQPGAVSTHRDLVAV